MFDLERSIKLWLKSFRKHQAFDHGSIREMELHVRDHIEDLISEGYSQQSAFEQAVSEFGEVPTMADEEFSNHRRKTTLRSILFTTMLKNYSKTSFRRILKNPLSSVINIIGLSIAIGICVLVYSFGYWIDNVDQFHKNKHEVYLSTAFIERNGELQQWGLSPLPLAEFLKADFEQINAVCRIQSLKAIIKLEDKVFHESPTFVDPSYLSMLTFPLKWGDPSSLTNANSIILSQDASIKYFGQENPIGQELQLIAGNESMMIFQVTGVAEEFPGSHSIDFDFLINFENLKLIDTSYTADDWSKTIRAVLVQVSDSSAIYTIESGMLKYKEFQNLAMDDWKVSKFQLEQLSTLYYNSPDINKSLTSRAYDTNNMARIILFILACFMLSLASVNYINIAIATAAKRLKEIGLRKSIGASRKMIIIQFLTENLIMTSLALLIGLVLGKLLFVPWFEYQNGYSSGFQLMDSNLWIYLVGVLLVTALMSGLYPAVYISRFQAVTIFKGTIKFGQRSLISEFFLGFQLILACILIVCAVMFTQNTTYLANRSWGYSPESKLYAEIDDFEMYEQLKNSMIQNSNVVEMAGGVDHIGRHLSTAVMNKEDKQYEVRDLKVDGNYLDVMNVTLIEGSGFHVDSENDKYSIIVNEQFIKELNLSNPIGEEYLINDEKYMIKGVVKDFHFNSFSSPLESVIIRLAKEEDYKMLVMSVLDNSEMEVYNDLKDQWATLFPEVPFRGGLQEDVWGTYFDDIQWHGEFWRIIAFVTILLAGLGLFGLVSLNLAGRMREFSIRKVLGAHLIHLIGTILKQYTILFTIALLIGAPLSYYLVGFFFDTVYTYHIPANVISVITAVLILLMVLGAVVMSQLAKITKANPVDGLKLE